MARVCGPYWSYWSLLDRLTHGQGHQIAQKRQGLPGAGEKKGKKQKQKQKWGGDITARRTNRSQSGFSVIHKDPPQYPSLRGFFYSHQGGRPTSTSPRSQISTSKKLHNCKKAANYVHTLAIFRPFRISNNAHAVTAPNAAG